MHEGRYGGADQQCRRGRAHDGLSPAGAPGGHRALQMLQGPVGGFEVPHGAVQHPAQGDLVQLVARTGEAGAASRAEAVVGAVAKAVAVAVTRGVAAPEAVAAPRAVTRSASGAPAAAEEVGERTCRVGGVGRTRVGCPELRVGVSLPPGVGDASVAASPLPVCAAVAAGAAPVPVGAALGQAPDAAGPVRIPVGAALGAPLSPVPVPVRSRRRR
ncbi:hypothetical protein [Streptomyces sp. NPDC059612]|uniref:hypothetical protein n=1 Tax=unclassified Streptomyces TaxID=2593676 RepID=UPI0036CD4088